MNSIKSISAKRAKLDKAIHELDSWARDEDEWRYVAIRDYDAAITALHAVMAELSGDNFANGWCGAIDEMVKKRYHFDEADVCKAQTMYYEFLHRV